MAKHRPARRDNRRAVRRLKTRQPTGGVPLDEQLEQAYRDPDADPDEVARLELELYLRDR